MPIGVLIALVNRCPYVDIPRGQPAWHEVLAKGVVPLMHVPLLPIPSNDSLVVYSFWTPREVGLVICNLESRPTQASIICKLPTPKLLREAVPTGH
jgi:hypothetical protein